MKRTTLLLLSIFPLLTLHAQKKIEPIFPPTANGLVYLEAEDAVATNFNSEATLDYSASGLRTLQLNRYTSLYQDAPFFTDFVFYAEEEGDYELWYGGTPPGPKDVLSPSFASPFKYRIDGGDPVPVYRENVNVVDSYSVTNFWSRYGSVRLTKGIHRIRLEITEKRRYDGKFYFFLDAIFLLKTGSAELSAEALPKLFPKDRTNRKLDNPYLSIAQYEAVIQANPTNIVAYIDFSKVYSLLGDFGNALKYLSRAHILDPENATVLLLMAKNQIWSGNYQDGLALYKQYLEKNNQALDIWAESAKVMAWLGKYNESLDLYTRGLEVFPEDLNLNVNKGLTFLWANRIKEGEDQLNKAWELARREEKAARELGEIYFVNGYPKKSIEVFQKSTEAFPRNLEFYFLLQNAYTRDGQEARAVESGKRIVDTFEPSEKLSSFIETRKEKEGIKQKALDDYQNRLALSPDDLNLRDELVKALFWNGKKEQAVKEYLNILVNQLYRDVLQQENNNQDVYKLLDSLYIYGGYFNQGRKVAEDRRLALEKAQSDYQKASREWIGKSKDAEKKKLTPAETKTLENLRAALDQQESRLAHEVALQAEWTNHFLEILNDFASLGAGTDPILQKDKDDVNRLKQLMGPKVWSWDKEGTQAELDDASSRGLLLADFVKARIALTDQRLNEAQLSFNRLRGKAGAPESTAAVLGQLALWKAGGLVNGEPPWSGGYFPYAADLQKIRDNLTAPAPAEAFFTPSTTSEAQELIQKLRQLGDKASEMRQVIQSHQEKLHQVLRNRMTFLFYVFDSNTNPIRYQLGDYYIGFGQFEQARHQLEKVLAMDPWNISAKYRLGTIQQMQGDWAGALGNYREVYQTDPKFENSASLHNQLAKAHPDRLHFWIRNFLDNARSHQQGVIDFQAAGSTNLGFNAAYTMDAVRFNKPATNAILPATYNLHTLLFSLPLSFPALGLKITPKGGAAFTNLLYENKLVPGLSPSDLLKQIKGNPVYGAETSWDLGPLNLWGAYTFDQVADTHLEDRSAVFSNSGEGAVSLYFAIPSPSVLTSVSSRTFAKADFLARPVSDADKNTRENRIYTAVQDLILGFHVADNPWTNLSLVLTGTYQNSTNPAETYYFSPNGIVTAKGGLTAATWIGTGGGWVLGLSGRAASGIYGEKVLSGTPGYYLQSDADLRFELSKGDMIFYTSLNTSFSSSGSALTYWSGLFQIGFQLGLPAYVVP